MAILVKYTCPLCWDHLSKHARLHAIFLWNAGIASLHGLDHCMPNTNIYSFDNHTNQIIHQTELWRLNWQNACHCLTHYYRVMITGCILRVLSSLGKVALWFFEVVVGTFKSLIPHAAFPSTRGLWNLQIICLCCIVSEMPPSGSNYVQGMISIRQPSY